MPACKTVQTKVVSITVVADIAAAAVDSVRQGKAVVRTAVDVLGTAMPPWFGVPEIERGMIVVEGRGVLYWHHSDSLPEMRDRST